jgi:hypothetical protein
MISYATFFFTAVGRLSLVLGLAKKTSVDSPETLEVIMKAAAQRLKTLP